MKTPLTISTGRGFQRANFHDANGDACSIQESSAIGDGATLTLEIRADAEDAEHIRLASLIAQLDAFRDVLRHTERVMYGREGGVYYRIVAMSQRSPAEITIEAIPANNRVEYGPALFGRVLENLETLTEPPSNYVPHELDLPALEAYRNLAPTPHRHISGFVVRNGRSGVALDRHFSDQVKKAIGPDQMTRGDVLGALEVINLHRKQRFEIFPPYESYRVLCRFRPDKKDEVIAALDKTVRVTGLVRYKQWSNKPHAVDVDSIQVVPREDDIPPFDALDGAISFMTDEMLKAARAQIARLARSRSRG